MMMNRSRTPDFMPTLSPGRHRNPRKGACFMEMASYLAGEKWSDHPACTHPLLASLARMVNDSVSNESRQRLTPMIPDVIGLTSDDVRVDIELALLCAHRALPVAALSRQHVLAVGILTAERLLAEMDERPLTSLGRESYDILALVPEAETWARTFADGSSGTPESFRNTAAPHIAAVSVEGIAQACIDDPDTRLVGLLTEGVALVKGMIGVRVPRTPSVPERRWSRLAR